MTEQLISLETAKLAKEKGFDLLVNHCFFGINDFKEQDWKHEYNNWNAYSVHISRPTQTLLQKWLRERPTPIIVTPITDFVAWEAEILNPDTGKIFVDKIDDRWIDSYEAALEAGLQAALNTL